MSIRYRALLAMIIVAAFGLAAVGCGSDDKDDIAAETTTAAAAEGSGSGDGTVAVSMGEWFIEPDVDTVAAGEITFDVTNDGEVEHEFIVLKTDIAAADLPLKGDEVNLAKAGEVVAGAHGNGEEEAAQEPGEEEAGHEHGEEEAAHEHGEEEAGGSGVSEEHKAEEHVEPGASASYSVDLEPGSYVLICNIAGHYTAGQWVEFTVE